MKRLTLILSMMLALVGFNANAAIYIVGDSPFAGWHTYNGTEMTDNGDGTYSYKATITGTVWFVFADQLTAGPSDDWTTFNGQYRFGPASGSDEAVTAGTEYTTQRSTSGAYKFTGSGEEYTITFDETNPKFKIEGDVEIPDVDTWTVAGSSTALFGTTWAAGNADNDMTLVNGLYTWSCDRAELTTSGFSFKVVYNHDWGTAYPSENYVQAIDKHGYYSVVITFDAETHDITCTPTLLEEIIDEQDPVYTVAGAPAALFGTEWAPALVENEMTKGNDGIYTWTKNNVELTAGNVEFKVVLGHEWGTEYPSSNYVATIPADDTYNVTITFNPANQEITFNATAVVPVEDFYTVAGSPASIFGAEWNPAFAANNMTLTNGLYTWTKDSVELTNGTKIEFKVVKNANWSTSWPQDNVEYTVAEDGTYDMTITYNPETNEVLYNFVKQGGEEPPVEMVYTVVGPEAIFGSNWDETDENNDMTLADGVYTWTKENVELAAGSFGFKVVGNHSWDNEWPMGYGNNWIKYVEEAGIYTIVITYEPEAEDSLKITCEITKTGSIEPVHYDGDVYIMGEVNDNGGWFTNVGVKMTRDEENNVYTATITTAGENIPEGEETGYSYFSFTKQLADSAADWDAIAPYRFGAVSDGDYWVTDEVLGTEIALTNGGAAFRVPAGEWNLTLSVDNMTLIIEKAAGLLGDVNEDGFVNVTDVTMLINAVVNDDYSSINFNNADMNGDGTLTVTDVTMLINAAMAN